MTAAKRPWARIMGPAVAAEGRPGEGPDRPGATVAGLAGNGTLATTLGVSALWLLALGLFAAWARGDLFTLYQVQTQDLHVVLPLAAALIALRYGAPGWRLPSRLPRAPVVLGGCGALAALLAWGSHALMWNFPLSRDEHMVVFDMAVYERARLAVPLASEWRAYAVALVPEFLFNDVEPEGLVSGYLPINALLRVAFARLADPAWLNPLLVLAGGTALFDIARRTFGADSRSVWVTMLGSAPR